MHARRQGWWPTNLTTVRTTIFGVPKLVAGYIGAIDAAQSNGMAGRSGKVRAGDSADQMYHFSGYFAYAATAALQGGVSTNLRRTPYTLLPATSGDVRTMTVQERLAQSVPGGWR
jgi:hypothetical protein